MNVIAQMDFELSSIEAIVQHFSHNATKTPSLGDT